MDNLLAVASAHEVVLPYLNDDDWALHLAAGLTRGSLTGSFVELAADPAAWFGSRGVARLTFVEADGEDGGGRGPDPVEPGEPGLGGAGGDMPIKLGWTQCSDVHDSGAAAGSPRAGVSRVPIGAVGILCVGGSVLNWILSPYAFKPPKRKMGNFRAELTKQFGPGLTARAYADAARTEAGRKKLRACYDRVWKTHNLHSMALYAGPAQQPLSTIHNTAWHGSFIRRVVRPGWVSTGDFDLSVQVRREKLIRYYSQYSSMVGQLGLPHHGSDLSFHRSILAAFPNLASALAAVGPNGHGHPGRAVQASVATISGVAFVRVDDNPSSEYWVEGPVRI